MVKKYKYISGLPMHEIIDPKWLENALIKCVLVFVLFKSSVRRLVVNSLVHHYINYISSFHKYKKIKEIFDFIKKNDSRDSQWNHYLIPIYSFWFSIRCSVSTLVSLLIWIAYCGVHLGVALPRKFSPYLRLEFETLIKDRAVSPLHYNSCWFIPILNAQLRLSCCQRRS